MTPGSVPTNRVFDTYGIPYFQIDAVTLLNASCLELKNPSDKKALVQLSKGFGLPQFLNPSVSDYALYGVGSMKVAQPEMVGSSIYLGTRYGHQPSRSPMFPDINPRKVIDDPLDLLEGLKNEGLVVKKAKISFLLTKEGKNTYLTHIVSTRAQCIYEDIQQTEKIEEAQGVTNRYRYRV